LATAATERLAPVQAAGNHQMDEEVETVIETQNQTLAQTMDIPERASLQRAQWRGRRAEDERIGETNRDESLIHRQSL
jgi:hypothetical protein